jgi:hypothetical protein
MKIKTLKLRNMSIYLYLITIIMLGCDGYESPNPNNHKDIETTAKLYTEQYDPIKDNGQYWHPEMKVKPVKYWNCVEVSPIDNINHLGEKQRHRGLQYHLLCQSIAGLANRAVEEGKSEVGVWLNDHSGKESYKGAKSALEGMGITEQGMQSGIELARNNYSPDDNGVELNLRHLFDGYVLTDVEKNPESNIVASIASHVYNSIIVDVRDKAYYEYIGYTMTYDATSKTTQDAWNEFKDQCNNKALVIMPVQTGQLREFAIKNNLFVINLNKQYNNPYAGKNTALLKEVLKWLAPNSPVYGWEQGVGEDEFVGEVSRSGNIMIPSDWSYNTSLTSLLYTERQTGLAKVLNPQFIDYEERNKKYVSYYLSDGDNVQWMMNDFIGTDYYTHPEASNMKMSFGLPVDNLSMIAPSMLGSLLDNQGRNTSIVQTFGGGYNYADNFGVDIGRSESLKKISEGIAAHMRQHRIKVLGLIAKDVRSNASIEAYQAYVDANDQLEGIIAVQYTPYAGGEGDVVWITNSKGYDIPVITVKYSLWNFNGNNHAREGSPAYIAEKLNSESVDDPFSLVCVHAWSGFDPNGISGGDIKGAGAAKLCTDLLDDDTKVVNVEELIWRMRMQNRPEQTKKYLNEVF